MNGNGERRNVNRMWWLVTAVIILLVVQYAANMVLLDACRKDMKRGEDRSVRVDNELRALAWCCASEIEIPKWTTPEPKLVRPIHLIEAMADNHLTYAETEIAMLVRIGGVDGQKGFWYVGDKSHAAAIEFRFAENQAVKVGATIWIVGKCKGKTDDGQRREHPKATFVVIVEDCRVVPTEGKQNGP